MPDMNENAETQQEYLGKVKPISAEDLQNENTSPYKMGLIMEMDADFVTLLNFVDWYAPTKEVNEKLTKMLRHIGSQTYQNQTKIEEAKGIIRELCGTVKALNNPNTQLTDIKGFLKKAEGFLKG